MVGWDRVPHAEARRVHTHEAEASLSFSYYCARCRTPAASSLRECRGCATPFTGAGSFDLVHGPTPSPEFAFLFPAGSGSHHRVGRDASSRQAGATA